MSNEFLLEIGVEEVPAGMLPPAFVNLENLINRALEEHRINHGSARATGTPRRIALVVNEVEERQPDIEEKRLGPPVSSAFDATGKPKPAATGFAAKMGLSVEQLEREQTPKGEYLSARRTIPGRSTIEVLAQILPGIITSIPWRKGMRWGDGSLAFVRPIQWIVALFGGNVVPFELEGVKSGNATRGHRFMNPGSIEISDYKDYAAKLKNAYVMVDHEERKRAVVDGVRKKAAELGGEPASYEELFDEVTFLVEWPIVISSTFPERYLEVPAPALIAAMVGHQRYFPLKDKNGKLLNHFITVANTPARDLEAVARGNARVLNARLADAEFFYRHDLKRPLPERVNDLKGIIYLKGVGSYFEKTERIQKLARWIAEKVAPIAEMIAPDDKSVAEFAARAAFLCKADLTTDMVKEFPSLQGVMGTIYAKAMGAPDPVAKAIEEHYLPRSAGDIDAGILPKSLPSACVAIADRADSLAACFGVGLIPKGDQDPYALRRGALGILAIIKSLSLRIPLGELISAAVGGMGDKTKRPKPELIAEIDEFIKERIRQQAIAHGAAADTAEAVIRSGHDDYLDVLDKAGALTEFRKRPDFEDIAVSFRRVGNILEGIHKWRVDESLFDLEAEALLFLAYLHLRDKVEAFAKYRNFAEALALMVELKPLVDNFFDDVLVNDPEDEPRKINRHSLLYQIHKMFLEVADFSAISR